MRAIVFRNAKKGVTLIRNEIKIEVPVIERLKNLFHDLVHLQKQKLYIDMDSNALVWRSFSLHVFLTSFRSKL